jgi:hypothetical protein
MFVLYNLWKYLYKKSNSQLCCSVANSLEIENSREMAQAVMLMSHSGQNHINKHFLFMRSITVPRFVKMYRWR